jgi:protein-disulfide isomerase
MFNKNKFPVLLFIIASCVSVIVLFFIYLIFTLNWSYFKFSQLEISENIKQDNDYYFINENYNEDPYTTKKPRLKDMLAGPIINSIDPSMGNSEASVYIVEFSDYECSYCAKQEQVLKKVLQKYEDRVRLIWKDYPKTDKNSASYNAAVAARCAKEQDKFWPYHDFLFNKNKELGKDAFLRVADLLELDMDLFNSCLDNPKVKRYIDDNIKEADALGITGVPFIYVNKQEIMGEISEDELIRIIEIELNR